MSLFCLVHGSGQGPSGWDLLVRELSRRGHETLCADLPTHEPEASATRYAKVIANALACESERAIVVAHSASGMFLPLVPQYCDIDLMVFLAAAVPEPGRSLRERFQADRRMFNPEWIGKDPINDHAVAREFLFHDCEPGIADWALTTLRLMYARAAIEEPCPLQRWPQLPSAYILATEDRTVNPDWWREEVKRLLNISPVELPGGHCPYVSRPAALADVLSSLAQ